VVAVVLGEGPDADAAEALASQVAKSAIFSQVRVVRSTELPAAVALPAGSGTPRTVILRFDREVSATLDDRAAQRVSDLSDALLAALAGR
jgi:predicted NAD/FAD-binding protein